MSYRKENGAGDPHYEPGGFLAAFTGVLDYAKQVDHGVGWILGLIVEGDAVVFHGRLSYPFCELHTQCAAPLIGLPFLSSMASCLHAAPMPLRR